jgi:anti-sigma regulatory factor (Ser/Thr protein kinase)
MAGWRERLFSSRRKPQDAAASTGVVWQLRVERERGAIGRLNDRLDESLRPSVPEPALRALQVALDELLTNVVMHARQASGPIELRVARSARSLDAQISYTAAEFDPTRVKEHVHATSVEDSEIGGLGVSLVRALMDEFRYEYADGRNVVHLRKKC